MQKNGRTEAVRPFLRVEKLRFFMHIAELRRRNAVVFMEQPRKVKFVVKSDLRGNFFNGNGSVAEQIMRLFKFNARKKA